MMGFGYTLGYHR
jgi:hypothetical protein